MKKKIIGNKKKNKKRNKKRRWERKKKNKNRKKRIRVRKRKWKNVFKLLSKNYKWFFFKKKERSILKVSIHINKVNIKI